VDDDVFVTPDEVVAPIAESLLAEIAGVRRPLDAEFVLCHVFQVVDRGVLGDDGEREAALSALLHQVIEHAEALRTEPALALARTCAALGPATSRSAAQAVAERLAGSGVTDRPWARTIGRPTPLRAWRYGDIFDEQDSVGVLFSYRGRDHALTVLIDHQLGGGLKDVWVAEGRDATELRDVVASAVATDPEIRFADVDLTTAAEVLRAALAQPVVPVEEDQLDDVAGLFHLAVTRTEHLSAVAGLPVSDL